MVGTTRAIRNEKYGPARLQGGTTRAIRDRIVLDPLLVDEHQKTWRDFIPRRPDDPADYYAELEEKEAEEEDADDDDGSIGAPNREGQHPCRSESDGDAEINQGA
jgi:hypothetical protein